MNSAGCGSESADRSKNEDFLIIWADCIEVPLACSDKLMEESLGHPRSIKLIISSISVSLSSCSMHHHARPGTLDVGIPLREPDIVLVGTPHRQGFSRSQSVPYLTQLTGEHAWSWCLWCQRPECCNQLGPQGWNLAVRMYSLKSSKISLTVSPWFHSLGIS